jgi:hypothetical protein
MTWWPGFAPCRQYGLPCRAGPRTDRGGELLVVVTPLPITAPSSCDYGENRCRFIFERLRAWASSEAVASPCNPESVVSPQPEIVAQTQAVGERPATGLAIANLRLGVQPSQSRRLVPGLEACYLGMGTV